MEEAGHEVDPALVIQGYFTYKSGLEAAEKLLARKRIPTAIFASNDDMAAAAISVAHRRGLDVPRDLSVVGFDDTSIATDGVARAHHHPPAHRRDGRGRHQPAAAQDPPAQGSACHPGRRSPGALRAGEARFGRAAAQALSLSAGCSAAGVSWRGLLSDTAITTLSRPLYGGRETRTPAGSKNIIHQGDSACLKLRLRYLPRPLIPAF